MVTPDMDMTVEDFLEVATPEQRDFLTDIDSKIAGAMAKERPLWDGLTEARLYRDALDTSHHDMAHHELWVRDAECRIDAVRSEIGSYLQQLVDNGLGNLRMVQTYYKMYTGRDLG